MYSCENPPSNNGLGISILRTSRRRLLTAEELLRPRHVHDPRTGPVFGYQTGKFRAASLTTLLVAVSDGWNGMGIILVQVEWETALSSAFHYPGYLAWRDPGWGVRSEILSHTINGHEGPQERDFYGNWWVCPPDAAAICCRSATTATLFGCPGRVEHHRAVPQP